MTIIDFLKNLRENYTIFEIFKNKNKKYMLIQACIDKKFFVNYIKKLDYRLKNLKEGIYFIKTNSLKYFFDKNLILDYYDEETNQFIFKENGKNLNFIKVNEVDFAYNNDKYKLYKENQKYFNYLEEIKKDKFLEFKLTKEELENIKEEVGKYKRIVIYNNEAVEGVSDIFLHYLTEDIERRIFLDNTFETKQIKYFYDTTDILNLLIRDYKAKLYMKSGILQLSTKLNKGEYLQIFITPKGKKFKKKSVISEEERKQNILNWMKTFSIISSFIILRTIIYILFEM